MFQELKQKLLSGQITFSEALPKALPQLRGKISDEKLLWLASELQGYSNAIEFYQNQNHGLPRYRIVPGALFLMTPDGNLNELKHPYAKRTDFFLSAPVSWLEEFARLQGDISIVEVPELTSFMSGAGGGVVCQTKKVELRRIIANFRNEFIALLDQVEPAN
ncbi:MAG: hypothetical protein JSS86_05505 [Cyanobacteria bacterium SZAS LIN-2]|nr:hypothetical protein [Cyanobacteria bacterium SZAS LIN-3]MBS1995743.1 hypothetical protein [Cyanobacteria bacterium SZAS LIN-2]